MHTVALSFSVLSACKFVPVVLVVHLVICLPDHWLVIVLSLLALAYNVSGGHSSAAAVAIALSLCPLCTAPWHIRTRHESSGQKAKCKREFDEQLGNYRVCLPEPLPEQSRPVHGKDSKDAAAKINATNFFPEGLRRVAITAWHVREGEGKKGRIVTVKKREETRTLAARVSHRRLLQFPFSFFT